MTRDLCCSMSKKTCHQIAAAAAAVINLLLLVVLYEVLDVFGRGGGALGEGAGPQLHISATHARLKPAIVSFTQAFRKHHLCITMKLRAHARTDTHTLAERRGGLKGWLPQAQDPIAPVASRN